jgi:hypothetical protein
VSPSQRSYPLSQPGIEPCFPGVRSVPQIRMRDGNKERMNEGQWKGAAIIAC